MNPVFIQLVKWILEKALIEAGKEANWDVIKADAMKLLDQSIPSTIFDAVAKYLCGLLIDLVAANFAQANIPVTPDAVRAAVDQASSSLLGRVAMDFLKK